MTAKDQSGSNHWNKPYTDINMVFHSQHLESIRISDIREVILTCEVTMSLEQVNMAIHHNKAHNYRKWI